MNAQARPQSAREQIDPNRQQHHGEDQHHGDIEPELGDGGIDIKWTPNAHTAIDGTLNPDFSQIESDVAAISTNERFAIFFPEKRPFFLERVELLTSRQNQLFGPVSVLPSSQVSPESMRPFPQPTKIDDVQDDGEPMHT